MNYQIVIPMTGVGQRFVDAGYKELKPLIKVDGKPIAQHVLEMFTDATKAICIISSDHPQKDNLRTEILRIRPDADIKEITAHKLGPGHAILEAKDIIDPKLPTLVSYCDWAGEWQVEAMLEQLIDHSGSILTYTGFHPHMMRSTKFAYVRKANNLVVDIQEKEPYTDTPMNEEASSGCYGFATGLLLINALEMQKMENENLNGEYYVSLTYKNLLRKNHKIGTVQMKKFFQWGTPEDLQDWEYWNTSVNALPGSIKDSLNVHNVVLAAGLGTRIAAVARVSKPNIVIAGQHLWEYSTPNDVKFKSCKIVTRAEVELVKRGDAEVIIVPRVTEGQAISARIGIESIESTSSSPINVLSSDNAFTPEIFRQAFAAIAQSELVVWVAKNYPLSKLNPNHYAWINLKNKKVIKKDTPPNFEDWDLITGNFTYQNRDLVLGLINELVERDIRVNGEFYLDSLIDLAFEKNLGVKTLNISNFIAVGTPEEFLTYQYFKKTELN